MNKIPKVGVTEGREATREKYKLNSLDTCWHWQVQDVHGMIIRY